MRVLLLRPDPGNERFGLGPFFRVEPLGLAYLAAAAEAESAQVTIADLRFSPSLATWMRKVRPQLVGISCLHALEYDRVVETAREVRRRAPDAFIVVGGHAAAAYPKALQDDAIDAIALGDGEATIVALLRALRGEGAMADVPGVMLRSPDGWTTTAAARREPLDRWPAPRRAVEQFRDGYRCLFHKPVWLVETARGCPYRCSFCSVSVLHGRALRMRGIEHVVDDFERVGDRIFVVDDLFFGDPSRSLELARALSKRGVRKRWLLVQSRADVIAKNPDLLRAWRPIAETIDVFLGLEAPTDRGLAQLSKDSNVSRTIDGISVLRELGFGVTGNFVVDPEWDEGDFAALWDFVATHQLRRAGYTILTPLPGTAYFEQVEHKLRGQPWWKFDMHHLLWEPRLGRERFVELFADTWRRSVLNLKGEKGIRGWLASTRARDVPDVVRMLLRTQRMMNPSAYLAET